MFDLEMLNPLKKAAFRRSAGVAHKAESLRSLLGGWEEKKNGK